jgi:hypothetical protein
MIQQAAIAACSTFMAVLTVWAMAPSSRQESTNYGSPAAQAIIGMGVGVLFSAIAFIWAIVLNAASGAFQ